MGFVLNGQQQFFDGNGDPLAGGSVAFYLPSTSTPVSTYQDAALTVANTNPVRLDGAGRAMIYASGAMRQMVTDASGNTIWDQTTQTAVSASQVAINLPTIAALRANTQAASSYSVLGYYTTGDGGEGVFNLVASDTTSSDNGGTIIVDAGGRRYYRDLGAFAHTVTGLQFGAKGDGSTNDTAALQAALATGYSVSLPGGRNYKVTGALTLIADGQRIIGDAPIASTITASGNFNVIQGTQGKQYQGASNLRIQCIGMTGGATIYTGRSDRFFVNDLDIYNPQIAINVYNTNLVEFRNVYVQAPAGAYGIYMHGTDNTDRTDVVRLYNVNIGGPQSAGSRTWTGIYWDGMVNTVEAYSCTVVNSKRGLHVVNSSGSTTYVPQFGIFQDFECDYSDEESVRIEAGSGFWFTSLYSQGSANTCGIYIGSGADSVKIANGYIRGHMKEGAQVGGQDCVFANCQFVFNSYPNLMTYDAVRILGSAIRVQFTGSSFGQLKGVGTVSRYGATVDNGARSIRFAACDFTGCVLGELLDNSGATYPGNIEIVGSGAQEYFVNDQITGWEMGCKDGSGCLLTPTIVAGAITAVAVSAAGVNYGAAPSIVAFDPAGTGSGFTATATVSGTGTITAIAVTNGGAGYSAGTLVVARSAASVPTLRSRFPGQPNVSAKIAANGAGTVFLGNAQGIGFSATAIDASTVNYLVARGRAIGASPDIIAAGSASNIDVGIVPKGTGLLSVSGPTVGTAGALVTYLTVRIGGTPYNIPLYAL